MFDKYVQKIREGGITTEIIAQIVADHKPMKERLIELKGRYVQDAASVPIFNRKLPEAHNKIDNKMAHDWFSEIVDTKTGYVFGVPIDISVDRNDPYADQIAEKIKNFRKMNSFDDVIAENAKSAAIGGYDPILAYIDTDGNERFMRLDPWEVCIITETTVTEPAYALRYYQTYDGEKRAEFFDERVIRTFAGKAWRELVEISERQMTEAGETLGRIHTFDYCPLFAIANNDELQGDAEKVLTLIDDYDKVNSDFSSEIEQFRLAYLLFYGVDPDSKTIEELKRTGILAIPAAEQGESENKVEYLTKTLDIAALTAHLDRLEKNIIRFSKHVNFTDAAFGGDLTGPAMRFKLFMLETKAMMMERKHVAAMMYLFKVIGSAWKKRDLPNFDYMNLDFKYSRNIPANIMDQATTAKALLGVVSMRTMLAAMPDIVPDPDAELRQIEEDKEGSVNLDDPNLNPLADQSGSSAQNTDGSSVGVNPEMSAARSTSAAPAAAPIATVQTAETGAV